MRAATSRERERLPGDRVTGKLTKRKAKGMFGWIQPHEPVNHPAAKQHGGEIYLAHEDLDTHVVEGADVSFSVYCDGEGLGAMHCQTATTGGVEAWEE